MSAVTLTSKGQLTLPRPLRDALGLAPGARGPASGQHRPAGTSAAGALAG
jgi:hypothetical protein